MAWKDADVAALSALLEDIQHRRTRIERIVTELRAQGCPWSVIGQALNMSKQAAQQRFGE